MYHCKHSRAKLAICAAQGQRSLSPDAQVEWWRGRAAHLTRIEEQVRERPHRTALGIAAASRLPEYKRWHELEAAVRAQCCAEVMTIWRP